MTKSFRELNEIHVNSVPRNASGVGESKRHSFTVIIELQSRLKGNFSNINQAMSSGNR